jgi:HPt (histidine-containing phosphotransfer) domain-containing protein
MGDEALATRVLTGFLEDMPDQLQALAKFVEAGSAQGVEDLAHRIKGASANVGGEAMRAVAQEMELAGRAGDLAAAQVRLPGLGAQFARLREAIVSGVIV